MLVKKVIVTIKSTVMLQTNKGIIESAFLKNIDVSLLTILIY
jgi:hypothetical protein